MKGTGESLRVKDWFADKIAQELKQDIAMCEVFGILKETDKAIFAILNIGWYKYKTKWVPKSAIAHYPVGKDEYKMMHYETFRFDNYNEAIQEFKLHWNQFN